LEAARSVVRHLQQEGQLPLGNFKPIASNSKSPRRIDEGRILSSFEGALEGLGPIELTLIGSRYSQDHQLCQHLLDTYHYLGSGRHFGDQLRYLISTPGGVVGCLVFSAAARRLSARDQWVSWTEECRKHNLHKIINNSRFLILPHIKVPNLASHVLGKAVATLRADWQKRHGYCPAVVETFVDVSRFQGISYRAANWMALGMTQGRGRQDARHRAEAGRKWILVFRLTKHWQQELQQMPQQRRLRPEPQAGVELAPEEDWIKEEFGNLDLGDVRLNRRLETIVKDFSAKPNAQIPQACGTRAKTKGAYRFFDQPRITSTVLLQQHYAATAQRAMREKVVLAVNDTTELNYSLHPATALLGPIDDKKELVHGMIVHSTMAYNLEATPLGFLDMRCWVRDEDNFGSRDKRYEYTINQKESYKWIASFESAEALQKKCQDTTVVSVGDREADIYELFQKACNSRAHLLVRCSRQRILEDEQSELWEHMKSVPVAGEVTVRTARKKGVSSRPAHLTVRFAAVKLRPPNRKPELGPVELYAIVAEELNPPPNTQPVQWWLLTTLPVTDFESAVEKLQWYGIRFQIEVFHRVLKSGCKIETRQLGTADRIDACLAIDMVVAWRIAHLTKLGREIPDHPCTVFFEKEEWEALVIFVTKKEPQEPPSLREATRMVANLGGFLGRKSDKDPGTQTIWLGLQRLDDITWTYKTLRGMGWGPRGTPAVSRDPTYG
jgi:hypothetical protein